MNKKILSFLSLFMLTLFADVWAEDVLRLEPSSGAETEFEVLQLLRVELMGDSIRFLETDGSLAAQVYKYDYRRLVVASKETPTGAESMTQKPSDGAKKVMINGQVYIIFGDKAYLISGAEVR